MTPKQLVGKFVYVKTPSQVGVDTWKRYYSSYGSKGIPGKYYQVIAYFGNSVFLEHSNWHSLKVIGLLPPSPIL